MTALEWIVKEAKKIRKEFPKRFKTWKEYVAQASAIYAKKHKGISPVGKKKVVKKKAAKKKAVGNYSINKATFVEAKKPKTKPRKRLKKPTEYKTVRRPDGTFKKIKRIAGIETKSKTHTDYNKPEVNIQIGAIKSGSRFIYYRNHKIEKKPIEITDGKKKRKAYVYITYGNVLHTLENAKAYIRHIAK